MIQNKYLADLFKLLPTPSLLLQNNFPLFTIIEANEPFLKLLNKQADEFIGKSIFDILLENRNNIEAKNILLQSLTNVIETKQHELLISYRFDILSTDKNLSNIKYWDLKNIPLLNELQELEFIIQCFTDVTERKETEDQLKLSETTFRNLLDSITELVYIQDEQGLFLEVNEAVAKTYGYDRNYFIGKSPELLAAPGKNDLESVSNAISLAWSDIPQHLEFWGITKDGTVFPKEVNLTLGNYFNKPVLIAVARDITEKIQAQQSLLASEERFKALVEFSSTGIIVHRNSYILYANPTAFKMIGANDEQEVIGKSFIEFVQPDFQKIVKNRIQTIPEVGTIIPKIEEKYIRFDGSEIIVEIQGISILYEGELAIQSSIIDITKHKKAEIAVEASETKFKTIIETSPDGIVISTLDGSIQYVNNVILEMFGFDTKNDILNKNIFSFLHESSQEKATYLISEMLKGNFRGASEYLMLKRDGSTFHCDINGNILKDSNAVPNGFIYVIRDSTEKKKEQQHLKLLESVITNAKDAILITEAEPFDEPGPRILYVNEAFTKSTGYTAAEVIGKSPRILQGEKSDMKELKKLSESIRKWKPCEISTINYKKDGTEFWQNISVTPVADENGWFTHWVSVQRDITEQKRAEEQLLTTNLKLATILDAIPDILFEVDIEGRIYNYHTHQTELLATTPELFLGKTFAEVIVSDAAAICQMAIDEASKKGLSTGKQYALQLPQGERWFEISVSKLQMTLEKTERYIFLSRDITVRKKAEIELMKSKKTLRNVLDNAPIGIWLMGADGRMEFVNKVFCDAVGITEEQFLAVPHYSELYPDELAEACKQSDKAALAKEGVNLSYENLIFSDGKMHQLEIQKNKVYNDNNPNPSLIGLMLDITEREKNNLIVRF
jgi:PAS domain S-box-containing protein